MKIKSKLLSIFPSQLADSILKRKIKKQFDLSQKFGLFPRQLAIETSSICNAKCVMCPYSTRKRKKGIMTADVHKIIIDKVASWNPNITSITHAGLGEPLIDVSLPQKIQYEKLSFPSAKVTVYTNGNLLNEKKCSELLNSGVDIISISLNAFSKDLYEQIMGISYDSTLKNLETLLQIRESYKNLIVNISLIPTELHSKEEINNFREYWIPRVDNVIIPPWISWGGYFSSNDKKTQWPCRYLWDTLIINWDGNVQICCEDYDNRYSPGNIINQMPDEIFNSIRMQEQREKQVCGTFFQPDICMNCVESHEVAKEFWENNSILLKNMKITESV